MDGVGDALGSRALTILPTDLEDRARKNRSGHGADPTVAVPYPGPEAATAPAPAPPPRFTPPEPPTEEDLTVRRHDEKPSEHVLRLAGDVRMLRHALDQVRKQLIDAVEACGREAAARAAAQAAVADARSNVHAELSHTQAALQAELVTARAEVLRLTGETDQLRQALVGAHRQAEQWAEQARLSESRVKSAMFAADRAADDADVRIAKVTEEQVAHSAAIEQLRQTAAAQRAELDTARRERDAALQRVAELEAQIVREQRHPRGNMAAVPSVPAAPGTPAGVTPVETIAGLPTTITPGVGAGVPTDVYDEHPVSLVTQIALEPWQEEALAIWADARHRGVIESVSSRGNTQLAHWAIGRAVDNSMKVLVLAPTAERVEQWYDGLRVALPINRVGKHTGRGGARLQSYDVVVATAQSAAKEHMFEPGLGVLIVADEVHEFGTPALAKALDDSYMWRLGLTSSYERADDGIAMYLDPYFGGTAFRLGYDRALDEQAIASFDLAMVAVPLSASERAEYDACAAVSFAGSGAKSAVRAYLKAVARRDEILATTTARDSVLRSFAAAARGAGRALVVSPTPQVAAHVERVLAGQSCTTISAGGDGDGRNRRGGRGDDDRDVWQLVTPRDAAEGVGSGDIDLAIMITPPRSRRELIERMDRILSGAPVGGHVRVVVLYVEGSVEDDTTSADAQPIAAVIPRAKRLQRFGARDNDGLLEFLVAGRRVVTLPPDYTADRLAPEGVAQPE